MLKISGIYGNVIFVVYMAKLMFLILVLDLVTSFKIIWNRKKSSTYSVVELIGTICSAVFEKLRISLVVIFMVAYDVEGNLHELKQGVMSNICDVDNS